jgi:hypothetical protein
MTSDALHYAKVQILPDVVPYSHSDGGSCPDLPPSISGMPVRSALSPSKHADSESCSNTDIESDTDKLDSDCEESGVPSSAAVAAADLLEVTAVPEDFPDVTASPSENPDAEDDIFEVESPALLPHTAVRRPSVSFLLRLQANIDSSDTGSQYTPCPGCQTHMAASTGGI